MMDTETIAVYDKQAGSYADLFKRGDVDPTLLDFMAQIEPGGYILDLGCGPASASSVMRQRGLRVDPVDASAEMVQLANSRYDIGARVALFSDISCHNVYDGVWANFSLLHATANDCRHIISALHDALKPSGIFHLGMKTGSGSARDRLGRFYTYYSEQELIQILTEAGFEIDHVKNGEGRGLAGTVDPWVTIRATAFHSDRAPSD